MGNNFGKPQDVETQKRIMRRGLELIAEVEVGGTLIDWPERWHTPVEYFTGKRRNSG